MKKIFGIQKNIFLLGLVSFFNDLSSEMILSIFPAFFTSVLKTGAASLGLVEGIADGAANIIKVYAGSFSDRIQKRKPFMFAGYALSVAIRPFYILMNAVPGVAGLRFLDRVGKGLREGPRDAIISLSVPREELGKSFGYHRAMDTAGALLGPLIAYLILRAYPLAFNKVFITAFIVGLLAVGTIFLVKDVAGVWSGKKLSWGVVSHYPASFKRFLLALFILSLGSLPVAIMLLKTEHIGLALASIPLFYMLYNLSFIIFSISAGKVGDKIGARKVMMAGYMVLLVGYLLLGVSQTTPMLVVAFLVLGLFPALTDGVGRAYASTLTESGNRAGAYGLMNAATGFGLLFAGIIGGYLWQHGGIVQALIVSGVCVTIGLVLLSTLTEKKS
jgi:MFS family permease